ncbi:MAG: glycosyltransferase family 2 protein [Acidobacteriota bacterium]
MKISVSLCTYNGSRFLREQLESIASQSRLPDEIVIVDDDSSDDTGKIAFDFAKKSVVPVTIHINETNLGSTRNFEKAIELCSGDVIALCDQDDVWLPQKLTRMEHEFASDPRVGLVFSNAYLVDENLKHLRRDLWRETFRSRDRSRFSRGDAADVLLQYNVVTGATLAFRAELRSLILPMPILRGLIHDGWIALIAAISSRIVALPEKLVKYRQHSSQQLGAGLSRWQISRVERCNLTIVDRKIAIARLNDFRKIFDFGFLELVEAMARTPECVPDVDEINRMLEEAETRIESHIAHLSARAKLSGSRALRVPQVLGEINTGRYGEYSRGLQSALLDLVYK